MQVLFYFILFSFYILSIQILNINNNKIIKIIIKWNEMKWNEMKWNEKGLDTIEKIAEASIPDIMKALSSISPFVSLNNKQEGSRRDEESLAIDIKNSARDHLSMM